MEKILSVAVPSYNVEKYLNKCLDSFSDDRLKEGLEVLIVNDGSTDRTPEIAAEYVERFPEIFRLINKENGGHGSAVNAGMDHATGKYFRIVDGDDWVLTDNLVRLLDILKDTDSDLVVDEKREVHMITGATNFTPLPDYVEKNKVYNFKDICDLNDIGTYIILHTLSAKTELLRKNHIHLLEHIFYVDYEYIVKTTCESNTIMFIDLEIYQYLVGNANQSVDSQNYVKRYDHHDKVVKELLRFSREKHYDGVLKAYLDRKIQLVIHSHYKIALIFDKDRKRGLSRGKTFNHYLKKRYPDYYKMTQKRYWTAVFLHFLGVDAGRLDKIMGRKA